MKVSSDPLHTILKAILPNESAHQKVAQSPKTHDIADKSAIRAEILAYVNKLRRYVNDEWKNRYTKIWEEIIDLEIIAQMVYTPGKQQGTDFNRNLVANIIHFLYSQKVYKEAYNASTMATALEGDKDHSVRAALGKDPSPVITSRLKRYFE